MQIPTSAEHLAELLGRNWADCGAYERQAIEDEFRRLTGIDEETRRLRALCVALQAAVVDLLPWASSHAERRRTSLHGNVKFQRIARAEAAIAAAAAELSQ